MSAYRPDDPTRRLARFSFGLVVLLVLSACGPSGGPGTPTPTMTTGGGLATETSATAAAETSGGPAGVVGEPVDVCSLASADDVAAVLGQAPLPATPGDAPDELTGTTIYFCTYLGQGVAVVISVAQADTPDGARSLLEGRVHQMQSQGGSPTSEPEQGLGDVAFWSTTSNGASYDFAVGSYAVGVSVGGSALGDPSAHRDALKTLAQTVAGNF